MPISDEIIELAPVKKTKTLMIIMFSAMGVLLALAVTFLVMYLIKPSFEEVTGRIIGVVEDSSALFQSSAVDGDGGPAKYASVGNEYTVKVTVSAEGDADPGVTWFVEPSGAVEDKGKGVVSSDESGKTFYFKFIPQSTYADGTTPITITARSLHDVNQHAQIKFFAVKQGTEEIRLSKYWTSKNTNGIDIEDGATLQLPYYTSRMNNPVFYMSYEQFGAYNNDSKEYSQITKVVGTDGARNSTLVSVSTPNTDVIEIGDVLDSDDVPKFTFKILKAGATATINITANINNDFAQQITKSITINTLSNSDLGYIDAIRVYKDPLTTAFYEANKNNQANLPRSTDVITLPSGSSYKGILNHIALSPFSLQYNGTALNSVSNWADKLEIISSDNDMVRYSNGSLHIGNFVVGRDCELTIRDRTAYSLGTEVKVTVKVVARNPSGAISVQSPSTNGKTYTEAELERMSANAGINTSQGVSAVLAVEYAIVAPSTTARDRLTSVLSCGYKISVKKDGVDVPNSMTVKLANLAYDNGKAVVENYSNDVIVGKESTFTDKTLCVIPGRGDSFTGVAMFQITVNSQASGVTDGLYTITFEKLGVEFAGEDDNINLYNPSWKKTFRLNVSENPTRAGFISVSEANNMISENRSNAGKFEITRVPQRVTNNNQTYWEGAASVYIQNRSASDFPFELSRLIELLNDDGVALDNQNGTISVNVPRVATSGVLVKSTDETNVRFSGTNLTNDNKDGPHAHAVITATDSAGKKIGQFDIDIYVIDAIARIVCAETTQRSINYSGSAAVSFTIDSVRSTTSHSEATNNYNVNDFDIEYGDGNKLNGTWDTQDGKFGYTATKKTFKIGSDTIFEYNRNSKTVVAKCDLFEYGYEHEGVDLSDIKVVYLLNDADIYFDSVKTCSRSYKFIRLADGVAIFTDDQYNSSSLVIDTTDSEKKSYGFNQGNPVNLFSSPVVVLSDDTRVYTRSETIVPAVEKVYFTVPSGFTLTGSTEITQGSSNYTAVSFKAPVVTSTTDPVDKYNFIAVCGGHSQQFEIRIENYARPIAEGGIGIYSDENCTVPLGNVVFGKLKADTDTPYSKPFWLQITYGAKGRYNKFEPAVITLPNGFQITDSDGHPITVTEFAESQGEVDKDTVVFKKQYYLKLLNTAEELENYTVDIKEAYITGTTPIKTSFGLSVYTGLVDIGLDVGGKSEIARISTEQASDIEYMFKFANLTDTTTNKAVLKVPLTFNTFAKNGGYSAVLYNNDKYLAASATTVSGLIVDVTHIKDDSPYLTVTVDRSKFETGKQYAFTVTFKDRVSGSEISFVANFKVYVSVDIFSIDATQSEYTLSPTGSDTGVQTATIGLRYNNGEAKYAPDDAFIANVDVYVVQKSGNTVTERPSGISVERSGNSFTLKVNNNKVGSDYYVRVSYSSASNKITKDYPIILVTQAKRIRATATNISANGKADIAVSSANQEFDLTAEVYNASDDSVVASQASSIDYNIYSDPTHETAISSSVATIVGGKLKLIAPTLRTGKIYFVASYDDETSGKPSTLEITVDYAVTISAVTLGGFAQTDKSFIAGTEGALDTIVLYRKDANNYTQLDLTDYILTSVPFGLSIPTSEVVKTVSVSGVLSVSGKLVKPTGVGTGTVTVTAKHGKYEPITYVCNVVVRGFDSLDSLLTLDNSTLNVVDNESATLTMSRYHDYEGITREYSVTASNNTNGQIVLNTTNYTTVVSLDLSKFQNAPASYYGSYTLTSAIKYVVPSTWSSKIVGEFKLTATRQFTVVFNYSLDFKLVQSKGGTDTDVTANTAWTVDDDATYKAVITSVYKSSNYWTYTVSSNNGIIPTTAFTSANLVLNGLNNKFGAFTATVTANAFGKTVTKSYNYTFTNGHGATGTLTANNGTLSFDSAFTATQDIGFDLTADPAKPKWVFTYTVDTSNVGATVAADEVDIVWTGNVTAGNKTKSGNTVYMTFTADKPTTLVVSGSVASNGVTYYTQKYTLVLTASEPRFSLDVPNTTVMPNGTLTFTVQNGSSGFVGSQTVEYSVIAGSAFASITSGGVLTASGVNTIDRTVVVFAKITVANGVYAGTEYKLYKEITVIGVPLPSVSASESEIECSVGSSVTLSAKFEPSLSVTTSGGAYTYDSSNISYTYDVISSVFEKNTDYTVSNGVLTILDTEKTKAGGRISVKATIAVTDGINKDQSVESDIIDVIIVPTQIMAVENITIFGKAGEYDVSNAIALYSDSRFDAIQPNDSYTISYTPKGAVPSGVTVSGSVITLASNIKEWATVNLDATVTITSGAYRGKVLSGTTSVKIYNQTVKSDNEVEFDVDSGVYGSMLATDMLDMNATAIQSVQVYAFDNVSVVRVENNGTANAEIFIDELFFGVSGYKSITVGFIITKTDGTELYGVGTIKAEYINSSVTITFDSLGGNKVNNQSVAVGGSVDGPSDPTKEGYVFGGWYTDSNCTDGNEYDFDSTVITAFTLYAKWTVKEYTVVLDVNGSNVVINKQSIAVEYDGYYSALSDVVLSREGYTFAGWWTTDKTGGQRIYATSKVEANADAQPLYARWTANSYEITLVYGGGRANGNMSVTFGEDYDKDILSGATRTGYTLIGWYTDTDGNGVCIYNATNNSVQTVAIANDHSLYAFWSQTITKTFTVTLDANDGKIAGLDSLPFTLAKGATLSVLNAVPVRENYEFDGWYTSKTGGDLVDANDTVSASARYYAHWSAVYTVSFDLNISDDTIAAGIEAPESITVVEGKQYVGLPTPDPVEYDDGDNHYVFEGWYLEAECTNKVEDGDKVSLSSDTTFYAKWVSSSVPDETI